jgi:hypothetical protein
MVKPSYSLNDLAKPSTGSSARKDLLGSPWLRYGIELELADRTLRRVHIAGERYIELDYASLSKPLSDKATRYVAEVIATFAKKATRSCTSSCTRNESRKQLASDSIRDLIALVLDLERPVEAREDLS